MAEAAAATRPHAARQLYSEVLERYIARRNRNDYQTAASLLIRLRGVMSDAGFSEYVSDLTQRFNRLSALRDELEKALAHH